MTLDIYIVDAFTSVPLKGNQAAVIALDDWFTDETMLAIAQENNLSETAFIKELAPNQYAIRWFSPLTEIDFCGHATLASSFVLFEQLGLSGTIEFVTMSVGSLFVSQEHDGKIQMSFPNRKPQYVDIPPALKDGLSIQPDKILRNEQAYFAVYTKREDVVSVTYDEEKLKSLYPYDVVVTSTDTDYDFVSRYFWPANGGIEDPVTGSVHAGLAPYWAEILGKDHLEAFQASKRGGELTCLVENDRVYVSGYGCLYLEGKIHLPTELAS
ncbi:PhzF family phenazine biosynthesis protein [Vibrio sp.]|nr:PhzF family phenazine biosynthesis protein [Vibrio sp.]